MKRPLTDLIASLFGEPRPKTILFRVDAGRVPGLSFGHAVRCRALARAAARAWGTRSVFLMRDYPEGLAYMAGQERLEVWSFSAQVGTLAEIEETLNAAAAINPDWLVIDLPYDELNLDYLAGMRRFGVRVLFIDDARFSCPAEVDVYLNSSVLAPGRFGRPANPDTRLLLGPEFFIFDEESLADEPVRTEGVVNVVVTLGGSDPTGLTVDVIRGIVSRPSWPGYFFRVVLGPGFGQPEQAVELSRRRAKEIELASNPANLTPYLSGSDLAVCSGGRTMYELLYLGRRFLPVATSPAEAEAIGAFVDLGLIEFGLTDRNIDKIMEWLQQGPDRTTPARARRGV